MDVSVQHRDRTEALQVRQCLRAVLGPPTPLGIHAPQRHVRENHDGRAFRKMLNVFLQPLQLFCAQAAQTPGLQVQDVYQSDEMHAVLVKAVPTRSLRSLPIPLQILFAIIVQHVVLAGNKEDIFGAGALQQLVHGVELFRFREMTDVSGVQDERGRHRQRVDLVHGGLQRANHVGVRGFVETHMAIADLNETEFSLEFMTAHSGDSSQAIGVQHSAFDHAQGARARPCHALQEAPAVDAVVVRFVASLFLRFNLHWLFLLRFRCGCTLRMPVVIANCRAPR